MMGRIYRETSRFGDKNMVSGEDFPKMFQSIDQY
jgi:hypothetical protein